MAYTKEFKSLSEHLNDLEKSLLAEETSENIEETLDAEINEETEEVVAEDADHKNAHDKEGKEGGSDDVDMDDEDGKKEHAHEPYDCDGDGKHDAKDHEAKEKGDCKESVSEGADPEIMKYTNLLLESE